ncbi:cobalamin biosynthesis protein [Archangium minus]|uniref:Cobalamin biosynthesis protein n=1 Tax=Archangium minus TaxID=83450 RepID=A0ABY9WWR2_9BACT|nr:cobalamin biosynthesis protein [Archangium minus]
MSLPPARKPYAVYAITLHGLGIAERLLAGLPGAELYVSEKLMAKAPAGALSMKLPMGPTLSRTFTAYDCHVFIISVGAVVRMIAPLLEDKKVDPAVVCVDDAARFSICVLSGHVGRGNAFTERVAGVLGSTPVVTTASDVRGTLTVDILGRELGWRLDDLERNVTRGCAAVVNETPVLFVQEAGEPTWWPEDKPLPPGVRYARSLEGVDPKAWEILLIATDRDIRETHRAHWENSVIYRPRSLVLGIGCDRGTPEELVERGVTQLLAQALLSPASVKTVATVDLKADEPALLALCKKYDWELQTYTAAELDAVPVPTPSETVKKHVGTRGVAEPSALLASGATELLVRKQIYTEPGAGRSMTFAVARIPHSPRKESVHV